MTNRICAAAVFALLALTAPAHAATIQWNLGNVTDGAGTVIGFFDYNTNTNTVTNWDIIDIESSPPPLDAFFTPQLSVGPCLFPFCGGGSIDFTTDLLVQVGGEPYFGDRQLSLDPLDPLDGSVTQVPLGSGSSLSGGPAEFYVPILSGAYLVDAEEVSAVPLPPALPMFGSAVIALAGFAAIRSRRTRRG
jgi:hypothetical protein